MMKTMLAGITAISLTLSPLPAVAQDTQNGFDHENLATAVFGLVVLGVLANALTKDRDSSDRVVTPPVVDHQPRRIAPERGGLRDQPGPRWHDNGGRIAPRRGIVVDTRAVPLSCLRSVETRFGTHRMFGRQCLQRKYTGFSRLPERCAVRVQSTSGLRSGFDPQCLRDQGYTGNRDH